MARGDWRPAGGAKAEAEALAKLKVPMLGKETECALYERGNTYDGKQARKARQS